MSSIDIVGDLNIIIAVLYLSIAFHMLYRSREDCVVLLLQLRRTS